MIQFQRRNPLALLSEPLNSLSVELEDSGLEPISETSEELSPNPASLSQHLQGWGGAESGLSSLLKKGTTGDPNVYPGLRATGKVPQNFNVLHLHLKSFGFLLFCDPFPLLQPHSPGGAGLVWNLITKQSPAPQGAACSPCARLEVLFMVSDFIISPPQSCSSAYRELWLSAACCLHGRGCRELGQDGWWSELIALAEKAVPFLRVIYIMQQGPACTQASPHQLSCHKALGWMGLHRP